MLVIVVNELVRFSSEKVFTMSEVKPRRNIRILNDAKWKPLGYDYFDLKTRNMFGKMFERNFATGIGEDAVKLLSQSY